MPTAFYRFILMALLLLPLAAHASDAEDFLAANVDPQARAEQLAIDDWSRLTLAINARRTLINDTATQ